MSAERKPGDDMVVEEGSQANSEHLNVPDSPTKSDSSMQPPPLSDYDALFADLSERPHNPDGWKRLVDMAEQSGDPKKIRATFDALLKQYPNTASAQIAYIHFFLSDQSTFAEAEELFRKFLKTSPSVDLWKFYLTYVRRLNSDPSKRDTVRKAYEFAINHVGQDRDSGEIWSDLIQFLKSGETSTTWEEQQKMDALRKVYHRAVQIPLDNVERLWQELETFETNLNKITAKKFMADLSPAYMQARTVLRQLTQHLNGLYPPEPAITASGRPDIWLPSLPKFDQAERALVGKWKAYLKWEESNPLEIEEKDKQTLITRLQGVYRKAVIRMRYYSEIWYLAYIWTSSVGKPDEAIAILKAGIEANPTSYLLNFAYAEAQETRREFADVHATYDKFLSALRSELEVLEKANPTTANGSITSNGDHSYPAAFGGSPDTGSNSNSQGQNDDKNKSSELAERRAEYGLGYIMYMRFGRRAEGVKSSRAIFGKARKDRWTPWHVYEAAALMEYHCSNDKTVASRIFEKGLDVFSDEIDFVLRYLGFLISINDENNARALFERVVPTFSPDRARPLWERWARYEYQYGDLEAAQKLEKRIAEVYPNDPPIKRFAQRHIYLGTDAIAQRDLGVALARKESSSSSSGSLTRTETQQSLVFGTPQGSTKRAPSPLGRREESRSGEFPLRKRDRSRSPMRERERDRDRDRERDRDRDRDRWEGPPPSSRRRFSPAAPAWERDSGRERGGPPPPRSVGRDDEKRGVTLPSVISWFIGELPGPASFDGPVFRTDDLMNVFRNAVIPSTTRAKSPPPPPPPRSGGRPPPDYGPYQGPGGSRRGRY